MRSQKGPGKRRLWAMIFQLLYLSIIAIPIWYQAVRVPRAPLPLEELARLEAAADNPLAAALPVTITFYVLCPGPGYPCLEHRELSGLAGQLGAEVLREAGRADEDRVPLVIRVLHDAPGSCTATSWEAQGVASYRRAVHAQWSEWGWQRPAPGISGGAAAGGGSSCMDVASSRELQRTVTGGKDRDFDDWAEKELAGQDRPGNYHLFLAPDPWLAATAPPYGSVGRHRVSLVRYPAGHKPTHGSVVRLAARIAAPAFASFMGPEQEELLPQLPLSPAAQLHLSFSLCNAHPSPSPSPPLRPGTAAAATAVGDSAAASAAAAFIWDFSQFEAQYITPVKQVLAPAARLTVSSQVLYFTPGRVNASWSPRHRAFVVPYNQLPFFVDSAWPLDPGRAGLPASAAGGATAPYDVATVAAGTRGVAVGEMLSAALPQEGAAGRAGAGTAAAKPWLLPPPAAESLPPAVLNFVLYAPQPWQRPLVLLGPEGEPAPANSFWVRSWGMLQVLNQVPEEGLLLAPVRQDAMEAFAVELVTQLRSLLGLSAARRRLIRLGNPSPPASSPRSSSSPSTRTRTATGNSTYDSSSSSNPDSAETTTDDPSAPLGPVSLLTALRTGLAPWEVDALLRRRCRRDLVEAVATLGSLARLLRQVPTLAVPGHVARRVWDAAAAARRALRLAAEGRYEETSRAAQEARSWAEAAFSDPSLSSRLNVPDTHMVGVYLPFCLPAAVPLLQALLHELKRWRQKQKAARAAGREQRQGKEGMVEAAREKAGGSRDGDVLVASGYQGSSDGCAEGGRGGGGKGDNATGSTAGAAGEGGGRRGTGMMDGTPADS